MVLGELTDHIAHHIGTGEINYTGPPVVTVYRSDKRRRRFTSLATENDLRMMVDPPPTAAEPVAPSPARVSPGIPAPITEEPADQPDVTSSESERVVLFPSVREAREWDKHALIHLRKLVIGP